MNTPVGIHLLKSLVKAWTAFTIGTELLTGSAIVASFFVVAKNATLLGALFGFAGPTWLGVTLAITASAGALLMAGSTLFATYKLAKSAYHLINDVVEFGIRRFITGVPATANTPAPNHGPQPNQVHLFGTQEPITNGNGMEYQNNNPIFAL